MEMNQCKDCIGWDQGAATPQQRLENLGLCRLHPPQVVLFPAGMTPAGMQYTLSAMYPPLPGNFPACYQMQPGYAAENEM